VNETRDEPRDVRLKRLLFRARYRGTQELDLIIGRFAERHLGELTDAQLDVFEALIHSSEPALFDWITGREPVPPAHDTDVMTLLRNFDPSKAAE